MAGRAVVLEGLSAQDQLPIDLSGRPQHSVAGTSVVLR